MFSNDTININNNINGFNNVYYGNYYNNDSNVNINDAKIIQYIQKKGSFDSNHNKYPFNMLVV